MIYQSFEELNGKTLKEHDIVIFRKNLKYDVNRSYLENRRYNYNRKIFNELKIDPLEIAICAYGYNVRYDGGYPEYHVDDYEAATRLVLILFGFIENTDVKVKIGRKWILFNIDKFSISSVKLNSYYIAYLKSKYIQVGCQSISYKAIKELFELAKEKKYI